MDAPTKRIGELKNLLEPICRALVDRPKELEITWYTFGEGAEMNVVFVLNAVKSEKAKLIGKHGKNIEAIRTILRGAARRFSVRVNVAFEGEGIR